MPTLDDVYRKFGEVSEAAQLLETELGTLVLWEKGVEAGLLSQKDPKLATEIHSQINKRTLGQLIRVAGEYEKSVEALSEHLNTALTERNRLFHSFYRHHNFRRNSSEGCQIMLDDLEEMHDTILNAYKEVMLLSGIDLDKLSNEELPTGHLPI